MATALYSPIADARRPCAYCGRLCKPAGIKHHERQCAANPDRRPRVVVEPAPPPPAPPLVTCEVCGRDGTPSPRNPARCKVCGISEESAAIRVATLGPPPLSPPAEIALSILQAGPGAELAARLRVAYLRARARDYGIGVRS